VTVGDPDGHDGTPSVVVVDQPAHGTTSVSADGAWAYTPTSETWVGSESVTYTVRDRHGAVATGRVTVTLSNAAPRPRPSPSRPAPSARRPGRSRPRTPTGTTTRRP